MGWGEFICDKGDGDGFQSESWAGIWCPAEGAAHGQEQGEWVAKGLCWMGSVPPGGHCHPGRAGLGGGRGGTEHPLPPSLLQGRGDPGEHPEEEGLEVQYGIPWFRAFPLDLEDFPPWLGLSQAVHGPSANGKGTPGVWGVHGDSRGL